jgi:tripartite-type tricarboxylate transporter receptor subunit TctC
MAGDVQACFSATPTCLTGIKAGMRALAITTAVRWVALPHVPTVAETLRGYEVNVWFGIGAPKDTPSTIVEKLNRAINASLADPAFTKSFADIPLPMTSADFGKLLAEETTKWTKVIRSANLTID